MYESPSQTPGFQEGNEWLYVEELESMAQWLCRGEESSAALADATRSIDTFREPDMVKRWIHDLTTAEVQNHLGEVACREFFDRTVAGRRPAHPRGRAFEEELAVRLGVLERLCSLPDNYRCAVLLKQGHGLSVERTAAVMGLSQASIRSILYRARQALRDVPETHH
jgi:DNA-directed RNA polymerase specialized sigma24 family protein